MKPLSDGNSKSRLSRVRAAGPAAQQCAGLLLETVPRVMRAIRLAMGRLDAPTVTVPQFRALNFIHEHDGPNLSATAEFLGLTLPSTSKLVDQLVRRGILTRGDDAADRRRMTLRLTARGDALLSSARDAISGQLAAMLDQAGAAELAALRNALVALQQTCIGMPPECASGGNVVDTHRAARVAAFAR